MVRRACGGKGHCTSCHEDVEFGYDMCTIDTPKGYVEVCCWVMKDYEDKVWAR